MDITPPSSGPSFRARVAALRSRAQDLPDVEAEPFRDVVDDLETMLAEWSRQHEVLDVSEHLAETIVLLRRMAGSGIEVRTQVTPAATRVRIESAPFERLLVHLALHAREALPRGGTLTLETLALDLDPACEEDLAAWHPGVPAGRWVLLAATIAADAPRGPIARPVEGREAELTAIHALVLQAGGVLRVTRAGPGYGRVKVYLPRRPS